MFDLGGFALLVLAFVLLGVALPALAAILGPRLVRRVPSRFRRAGGVAALVVFAFGYLSPYSFRGQDADVLAVSLACIGLWMWAAAAPARVRGVTLAVWVLLVLGLFDEGRVWPVPHLQSSRGDAQEPPYRTIALPCGRTAEFRLYGYSFTSSGTEVTVWTQYLAGLLEREHAHEYFDDDEYRKEGLDIEAAGPGCTVAVSYDGAEIWRVD